MATLEPMKWYIDDQNARNSKINEVKHKKKKEKTRYKLEKKNKFKKLTKKINKKDVLIISIAVGTVAVLSSALALYFIKNNDNIDSTRVVVFDHNPFVCEEPIEDEIVYENETIRHEKMVAEERAKEAKKIKLDIGSSYDTVKNKLKPNEFVSFLKFGEMYGVDPNLIFSIAAQESGLKHRALIPGGSDYNDNAAIGICQIEKIKDRKIKAHNCLTGKEDSLNLSEDNMIDYDKNIQACAMIMQNNIYKFNGNIYLAVQAYNYGEYLVQNAVEQYANDCGKTPDEIKENYEDCGWMTYIKEIHEHPEYYILGVEGTYGDDKYLNHVFRYYSSDICNFYYDKEITFDFKNNKIVNNEKTRK